MLCTHVVPPSLCFHKHCDRSAAWQCTLTRSTRGWSALSLPAPEVIGRSALDPVGRVPGMCRYTGPQQLYVLQHPVVTNQTNLQLMNVSLRNTDVHHQGRASWELWHHDVVTVRTKIEPANQNTYLKVLAVTSDPSFETASQTWRRHHIMINPLCLIKYISTFICSKTGKAIIVGASECRRALFTKGS